MTKALDGLRLGASSKSVAFADLSADDIVANMSDDTRAAVAAALAPAKSENPPEANEHGAAAKETEAGTAPAAPEADAADPAHAQFAHGFAAAVDRNKAVFASEHYAGREKAAATMLGNAKLSAEDIVSTLADLPKGAGGDGMLAHLAAPPNPDLKPGTESGGGNSRAEADAYWDRVHAKAFPVNQQK